MLTRRRAPGPATGRADRPTPRLAATRNPAPDIGFTLVELVLAVAILGILMSAVTGALLVALSQHTQTSGRLGAARDLGQVTLWFSEDVQGARTAGAGGAPRCGSDPAADVVLQLVGGTFDPAALPAAPPSVGGPQPVVITYVRRAVTGPDGAAYELHRLTCATDPQPVADDDRVLARSLSTATPPAATVTTTGGGTQVSLVLTPTGGAAGTTLVARRRTS